MFKLTSSPHTHSGALTAKVMLWVIAAMLPALMVQVYYFGYGVLIQIILAVTLALALEFMVTRLRNKPKFFYIKDFSVTLTALILAMAIPPYAPYWIILIGTFCAVILGKHVYGGLGQNLFNPAMVGYVILLISFPVQMTTWMPPVSLFEHSPTLLDTMHLIFQESTRNGLSLAQFSAGIDGFSQATPLNVFKTATKEGFLSYSEIHQNPILQSILPLTDRYWLEGIGWTQINLAFFVGGVFLIWKKVIHWQIPTAFLITLFILASIHWLVVDASPTPIWQMVSGATMFGAFFIATDPVTASITPKGKIVFGMLIALLVYIIRYFGGFPDAIAFAILLANICVPLIDHYTRPRVAGHHIKRGA